MHAHACSFRTPARCRRLQEAALEHLCSKLGIEPGGTTPDGLFTVQPCECLGACADAPVMLVNDRQMLSFMNDERLDEMIETLKGQG